MSPVEAYQFIAKNDDLPTIIRAPILLFSGIVFQSLGYMDKSERRYKLIQNISFAVLIYKKSLSTPYLPALLLGHFLGGVLNGQIPVVLKNLGLTRTSSKKFDEWEGLLTEIGDEKASISAIGVYGSLSRGELSATSDLDVRVIRREGFLEALEACFIVNLLRIAATLTLFPLDIYVLDSSESLDELREDEKVHILVDKDDVFSSDQGEVP